MRAMCFWPQISDSLQRFGARILSSTSVNAWFTLHTHLSKKGSLIWLTHGSLSVFPFYSGCLHISKDPSLKNFVGLNPSPTMDYTCYQSYMTRRLNLSKIDDFDLKNWPQNFDHLHWWSKVLFGCLNEDFEIYFNPLDFYMWKGPKIYNQGRQNRPK